LIAIAFLAPPNNNPREFSKVESLLGEEKNTLKTLSKKL